jgi:hypothetical protein
MAVVIPWMVYGVRRDLLKLDVENFGMDLGISAISTLQYLLTTLFAFWLILILAPITWKRTSINPMIAIWGLLALVRVVLIFMPADGIVIIREPLNSILFMAAGLILGVVLVIGRRQRGRDQP